MRSTLISPLMRPVSFCWRSDRDSITSRRDLDHQSRVMGAYGLHRQKHGMIEPGTNRMICWRQAPERTETCYTQGI